MAWWEWLWVAYELSALALYVCVGGYLAVLVGRDLVRNPRCRRWAWIRRNVPVPVIWPVIIVWATVRGANAD